MNEGIEKLPSGREILKELESGGKYLFHGSRELGVQELEPRQAYSFTDKDNKIPIDKPGVFASPRADIAIFVSIINRRNCPDGFTSGFGEDEDTNQVEFRVTQEALDQLSDDSVGEVHVFLKDDFVPRESSTEWISYKKVVPIKTIRVRKSDLPDNLKIKKNALYYKKDNE